MQDCIHHLIAFPTVYFEATKKVREIQDSGDKKAWKEFKKSKLWYDYLNHGVYRGSWLDKDALITRIKESTDVYDINEGWYDYLLIETHSLNCIDGRRFDPPSFTESEMWFKFVKLGEDDYEYQQIPRPACLAGVCNFL